MVRKGDTLIEVTLAVGIFSMIAIAVVSVMSGGTSSAQTALETTLAREEIDTQAEALRFIQSAYVSDKDSNDHRYQNLWNLITSKAIDPKNNQGVLQFTPKTCLELYDPTDGIVTQNAFVINPRLLSSFTEEEASVKSVYVTDRLDYARTYPHLIFSKNETSSENDAETEDISNIVDTSLATNLFRAEGIYVIAVKDADTTTIADDKNTIKNTAAFYDFYIRTCWYGTDAEQPSTISTVIRLYDPAIIKTKSESTPESGD